ncbi:PepSY domain-containing protein [Pelagerythrobacter aerophilus]
MRITAPLALLATAAGPLVYVAAPAIAQGSKSQGDRPSKAAREHAEQEAIRRAVQRGELLPLPRILAIAQSKVPGDIVKVELEYESWGIKYEVKILTPSGRVREVELDARTAALIKIEDD